MNSRFDGQIVLVTGATGLIGSNLVKKLISDNAKVIAVVRDLEKAQAIFTNCDNLEYVVGDVRTIDLLGRKVDYIVHAASKTSSKAFVTNPVETIEIAYEGTKNILDYAKTLPELKKMIYLSTMEVYGAPVTDEKIDEKHNTNLDTMQVRSCYPESKRMCENLCVAYGTEYDVPIDVLRLTQTFGSGVDYEDGRVFAEFARCAVEKKNIILKTKGETKRSYLSVDDAVSAIIILLLSKKSGEAYNAANEDTYCSIYEMARMVADKIANGTIGVEIQEDVTNKSGYAPTLHMNLDTKKLQMLGWSATDDLLTMYEKMIKTF